MTEAICSRSMSIPAAATSARTGMIDARVAG
jgi:hypothetical protein